MERQPLVRGAGASRSPGRQLPTWTLLGTMCAAGIGGTFQYGYNVSLISAPTQHIHKFLNDTWQSRYQTKLSSSMLTLLWSTIASIFSLGGFFGAHLGSVLAGWLGRKGALLMNNLLAFFAATLMGASFPTGLFELLIVGRFLIGMNTGIGLCVQPLYIGEAAPRHLRGAMAMSSSIFLTGALKRFHGPLHYQKELEDIQRENFALGGEKAKKPWELFADRSIRWQLIAVICLTMGQQLSGINAIYFYANYVFAETGIPPEKIPYVTLGTGMCECLTALTCGLVVESLGRRALILGGYCLMMLWCFILTISLNFQVHEWAPYLSMACVFAFILSFGLGPGGVTNILTTELFMQSSRPGAYTIAGSVSWLSFFTVGMLFPFVVKGLKQYCFTVFLLECSAVATFIFCIIPETKNKTFLEIKREFHKLNFRRAKEPYEASCERQQLCPEV